MTSPSSAQPQRNPQPLAMPRTTAPRRPPAAALSRRSWLAHTTAALSAMGANGLLAPAWAQTPPQAHPHPGLPDPRPLQLGHAGATWRDHGSHPEWNTEWWYATGWLHTGDLPPDQAPAYGFQLTFFRSRVRSSAGMSAPLAAQHLISAHLAVTDVRAQRLLHEERVGRAAQSPTLSLGEAREGDLHVRLGNWHLSREGVAATAIQAAAPANANTTPLLAQLPGRELGLNLRLTPTQAPLVQGQGGLSRKGPDAQQISYYYSMPQLAVSGELRVGAHTHRVQGRAWLDHEWSTALMHPDAVGWDWIGMNLNDGSALTAFRLRTATGQTLWTGGSWRSATASQAQVFGGTDVVFEPLAHWQSPASHATYPVHWRVRTPAGVFEVRAITPQQELDARASTGAIYWEGLCALHAASGPSVGWGYLEMTGYAHRLKL